MPLRRVAEISLAKGSSAPILLTSIDRSSPDVDLRSHSPPPRSRRPRRWRSLLTLAVGVLGLVVVLDAAIKALAPLWDWLLGSVAGL